MKLISKALTAAIAISFGITLTPAQAFADSDWCVESVGVYQAEDGVFHGNVRVEKNGSVSGFHQDGDSCDVVISVPRTGFYDLAFMLKSQGGYKENFVSVDGQRVGTISAEGRKYVRDEIRRVYLEEGEHIVSVSKYWGYINWDKVTVLTSKPFDEAIFQVSGRLVDKNASDNARRLFSYLCDQYGKAILSGQYCDTGMNGWENLQISQNNGGKFPAILGLDMGYYSQTGVDHNISIKTTEQAIACWEKGGIVTICWHWLAPEKYITGTWYRAFRPEEVKMNLSAIMNGEDEEGLNLLRQDIENVAAELLKMKEAGVPVLWRPLHEASDGWFWWGGESGEGILEKFSIQSTQWCGSIADSARNSRRPGSGFRVSVSQSDSHRRYLCSDDDCMESAMLLDANFAEDWGDCLYIDTVLFHGEKKLHKVEITIAEAHENDAAPFYLVSVIGSY